MRPGERLQVLLLAAGLSRRMGAKNKLLMDWKGQPLVRHVAEQLLAAGLGPVTVVTGFEAARVEAALAGLALSSCFNPDFEAGQMASVRNGCAAIAAGEAFAGVMVALADMPALTAEHYRALAAAFFSGGR